MRISSGILLDHVVLELIQVLGKQNRHRIDIMQQGNEDIGKVTNALVKFDVIRLGNIR